MTTYHMHNSRITSMKLVYIHDFLKFNNAGRRLRVVFLFE